ncbi:hypothetical protein SAMN04487969_11965 [Paenibacillus algorifonticola]|uniref:Bacteriophage lambda head decoration protein D n=1 Tax=Paenibacillus algorifonticola TaxID=684063 RepID=A0A1I2H2I8_9BACL|nr:hypothetical protein [Paenibacillus algorifonticola]SFF23026.1 hypothetical protein SAMN04487969_11965 [Paenibacillus algorifonticola]
MKFTSQTYGNTKEILKTPDHYVDIPVTVDDTGITAVDGKKIVPAGTIIGNGMLADPTKLAKKAVTTTGVSNAEGVLQYDVDVTYGPAPGAMIIHGYIDKTKLPVQPTADEITALKQITFIA